MKLKNIIKKGLSDSFIIWRTELNHVFKDMGVVIFFLVVPLAYPLIYGLIYNPETIHEVPLVVVDQSHSSIAREFVRKIDATPDVHVYMYASDMEEAIEIVKKKEAYGILLIPYEFSQDIHRGIQTTVSLYCDMSGMLFYKAILLATTEASLEMGKVVNVSASDVPIPYESVSLYNTQNGFASFLVPAILVLVIQQTLLLGIGMLAATDREKSPHGRMVPPGSLYEGTIRVVFGKALAYLSIYVFVCLWALVIVPYIFGLPQIAPYGSILLFTLPYLLACIFISMAVSGLVRGRETPMMLFVVSSLPLLFLSGVSWPASAIPPFWKWISYLFPSTFGIQGYIKLNTMGATLSEVALEYRVLWLQTGIYFLITCLMYRYQIKRRATERKKLKLFQKK